MTEMRTRKGEPKLVEKCSYPLTGIGCVSRIYTDVAVIDLGPDGAKVVDMIEGMTFEQLQTLTEVKLQDART